VPSTPPVTFSTEPETQDAFADPTEWAYYDVPVNNATYNPYGPDNSDMLPGSECVVSSVAGQNPFGSGAASYGALYGNYRASDAPRSPIATTRERSLSPRRGTPPLESSPRPMRSGHSASLPRATQSPHYTRSPRVRSPSATPPGARSPHVRSPSASPPPRQQPASPPWMPIQHTGQYQPTHQAASGTAQRDRATGDASRGGRPQRYGDAARGGHQQQRYGDAARGGRRHERSDMAFCLRIPYNAWTAFGYHPPLRIGQETQNYDWVSLGLVPPLPLRDAAAAFNWELHGFRPPVPLETSVSVSYPTPYPGPSASYPAPTPSYPALTPSYPAPTPSHPAPTPSYHGPPSQAKPAPPPPPANRAHPGPWCSLGGAADPRHGGQRRPGPGQDTSSRPFTQGRSMRYM
jgi:hypothetical protein